MKFVFHELCEFVKFISDAKKFDSLISLFNLTFLAVDDTFYSREFNKTHSIFSRCEMDSAEVRLRYQEGTQAEADETTSIRFLAKSDISQLRSDPNSIWNELAPSAKGCLMLYSHQYQH
jgi:hypothetical protein